MLPFDTGGRISYNTAKGSWFTRSKRWTPAKDKVLWEVMNQKTGTMSDRVRRYWKRCEKKGWWKNGSPYPTAVINRYYLLKSAIEATHEEINLE